MSQMADLLQLIERDIPGGRKHLSESNANLQNVATYCEENYLQARDKRHALEETKNYTTQSLASVAYQINTLATNFLHLLDLQMNQLNDMESSVNHISQTVMIHKEKVARREIGVLTTNKTTTRPPGVKNPGIVFPDQPERPVKYVRKSIDYTQLDEIGHGVKQAQPQNPVRRRTSSSGTGPPPSSASGAPRPAGPVGQAPTTRPPTPPNSAIYSRPSAGAGGTLSRQSSASPYRTPVSPPSLPSHYAPNYPKPQQAPPPQPKSGYATSRSVMPQAPQAPPPAPPTGMVHPMAHQTSVQDQVPPPTPPLPPMPDAGLQHPIGLNDPPPPPPPESPFGIRTSGMRNPPASPPLPPPPPAQMSFDLSDAPPPPVFSQDYGAAGAPQSYGARVGSTRIGSSVAARDVSSPDWVPDKYLEKVVAIYNYEKDKEDELSFSEGSVIYVVKKNDDGWWEGVMHGVTGLFPGNYVEPCI